MPAKSTFFDDGVVVATEDRETIKYIDGEKVALVWVDYEPGLFKRGRVIKLSSLRNWASASPLQEDQNVISDSDKQKIVERVSQYLRGTPVRVENDLR